MVAVIAVRYVNSEVLRGGLGAKIYESCHCMTLVLVSKEQPAREE